MPEQSILRQSPDMHSLTRPPRIGSARRVTCTGNWCSRLAERGHGIDEPCRQFFMTNPVPVWTPVPVPAQAPVSEAVAELPGTRLWYWDTGGSGRPVVLLHAATHSAAGWVYQQPVLAAAGYRVIAYSRRGYFGSDPGDPANPGYAADDLDNLLRHLKLDQVDLVAAAHGGFFALDFALAYPAKVRTLTIVASLMGITDADYQ